MKWITIICFALLTLLKSVSQFVWQVWYEVNQEFVANNLCENQAKPELECNGKCYLMKQLQTAEVSPVSDNEQQKRSINPFLLKLDLITAVQFSWKHESHFDRSHQRSSFRYDLNTSKGIPTSIFHPPIG